MATYSPDAARHAAFIRGYAELCIRYKCGFKAQGDGRWRVDDFGSVGADRHFGIPVDFHQILPLLEPAEAAGGPGTRAWFIRSKVGGGRVVVAGDGDVVTYYPHAEDPPRYATDDEVREYGGSE